MLTISDILEELEQEAPGTRRVLERIPEDQLEWRPHAKSMTMGQLAMHVANLPGAIVEVSRRPFDVNTPIPRPGATSRAEILAAFEDSMERSRRLLGGMDDTDLAAPWSMMKGDQELWSIPRGRFSARSCSITGITTGDNWWSISGRLALWCRPSSATAPTRR